MNGSITPALSFIPDPRNLPSASIGTKLSQAVGILAGFILRCIQSAANLCLRIVNGVAVTVHTNRFWTTAIFFVLSLFGYWILQVTDVDPPCVSGIMGWIFFLWVVYAICSI